MGRQRTTACASLSIAGASVCFVLFALLAFGVSSGSLVPTDTEIRSAVHSWASAIFTTLAYDFSLLGSAAILALLFVVAATGFWLSGQRRAAFGLAATMTGAIVLENALKYGFHRIRPQPFFGAAPETFSFPSGHALFSTCFYGAAAYFLASNFRNLSSRAVIWAIALLLAGSIGISRIYLGFHYPSDVAGGMLVAIFWLAALHSFGLLRGEHRAGA
jgi:undecaprenyl-diphosphatase